MIALELSVMRSFALIVPFVSSSSEIHLDASHFEGEFSGTALEPLLLLPLTHCSSARLLGFGQFGINLCSIIGQQRDNSSQILTVPVPAPFPSADASIVAPDLVFPSYLPVSIADRLRKVPRWLDPVPVIVTVASMAMRMADVAVDRPQYCLSAEHKQPLDTVLQVTSSAWI